MQVPLDAGLMAHRGYERLASARVVLAAPDVPPLALARLAPQARPLPEGEPAEGTVVLYSTSPPPLPGELIPAPHPLLAAAQMAGVDLGAGPLILVSEPVEDWDSLLDAGGTLLISPGAGDLARVRRDLDEAGLPASAPAVLLEQPLTPAQRRRVGTLTGMEAEGDWVLVLGRAAARPLAPESSAGLPLRGRRIVVTRARQQAVALWDRLEALGAWVIPAPVIEIAPPEEPELLDRALAEIESFHWLLFTSANAVPPFMAGLLRQGKDARSLAHLTLACIGPATARALERHGLRADLVPREYVAEGLLEALRACPLEGRRVLLPRAAEARDVLPQTLKEWGATVEVVPVYRTVTAPTLPPGVADELRRGVDLVTFTSSSTVRSFHRLTAELVPPERLPALAIGPVTAAVAQELGYPLAGVAQEYDLEGLVAAALRLGHGTARTDATRDLTGEEPAGQNHAAAPQAPPSGPGPLTDAAPSGHHEA